MLFFLLEINPSLAQRGIDSVMANAFQLERGEEQARQFLKIASAFYGIERDTAEYFFELASEIIVDLSTPELVAASKTLAAEIFRQDWPMDTLVELLTSAADYYDKINDQKKFLELLITQGALYSNKGLNEEALPYNIEALDLATKLKDTLQQGKIAYNLGVIYYNTSLQEEAIRKFKEARQYFISIDNESMAGIALSGMVNVYLNTDRNDTALFYARQLLAIGDTLRYSRLQLNARSNLGAIHNNLGQYELAAKYYHESEPFARRFGSKLSLINCWCALGKSLAFMNQLDSAEHYFAKAYSLNNGENMSIMHHYCSKEYADVLQRKGKYASASKLLSQYVTYQDSILIKDNKEVIAGLEAKYQASQKDAQITQQKLTIEQRTSQRNFGLLSLLISAGLAGFMIYRYRQNKRLQTEKIANLEKYQKILMMDSMLQGQEEERKRIAQDLHDGLGTLLVSARLQMQNAQQQLLKIGNSLKLHQAENLIDSACKEVRRIAHDMMPSALVDLGFIDALRDLISEFKSDKSLKIELNTVEPMPSLDNVTSLNLYRIIQEILQNVIKHAEANVVGIQIIPENNNKLLVEISDDGIGFDTHSVKEGLGLSTIRSRVEYLTGSLRLESKPGEGSTYNIEIPISSI